MENTFQQLSKQDLLNLNQGDTFYHSKWDGTINEVPLNVESTKINAKGNKAIRYSYFCDYRKRTCYGNITLGNGINEKGEQRLYSDSSTSGTYRTGTRTFYKLS